MKNAPLRSTAPMHLLIISGLSGAGKSIALRSFEDQGYYCIDNMPIALLPQYVREASQSGNPVYSHTAISIDVRTGAADTLAAQLAELDQLDVECQIVFLMADSESLLRRYAETRRKHPLSNDETPLAEAIRQEFEILEPIADQAQITIDTTDMSVHELRDTLRQCSGSRDMQITLLFQSFGFKRGAPRNTDFVFDVRCLPNPYWEPELRQYSGLDQPVKDFFSKRAITRKMLDDISNYLDSWLPEFEDNDRSYLTVGIGCTGGQHRSVYIAERLAERFKSSPWRVIVRHRESSSAGMTGKSDH